MPDPEPLVEDLLARLRRSDDLPALQPVVLLTLRLLQSRRGDNAEVARLLGHDQVLTARVLRLANSAFYATRERVTNPEHAIVLLGTHTLRSLILRATIFSGADHPSERELWLHALGTACAARAVAATGDRGRPEELFIAGLLHDIGKLAIARGEPATWEAVRARAEVEDRLALELERELLGYDHALVGARLCAHWALPGPIAIAVASHHAARTDTWPSPAAVVHLADVLARAMLVGSGGDRVMPRLDPDALAVLRCGPEDFPALFAAAERELARAEVFFDILEP